MVQLYDVTGYAVPLVTQKGSVYIPRLKDGVETALSDYSGPTDPNPGTWGVAHVGYKWLDTSDPSNPKLKRWQLLVTAATYGWRVVRIYKTKWLVTPKAVTLAGSPAAADIPVATHDFTSELDDGASGNVQDAGGQENAAVVGVWLRCVIQTGAAETIGTGATKNAYLQWTTTGSTNSQRVRANIANHEEEGTIFVPLATGETADWLVKVGGGTAAFAFSVTILGFVEEL